MKTYTPMEPSVKKELVVKNSRVKGIGKGCFAGQNFRKGEIIGEYTGEILHEEDAARRGDGEAHDFLFDLGEGLVIDPRYDPNPVKYINHSCNPNCESEQEGMRILIKALRKIEKGEELFYEYNMQADDDAENLDCHCGAPQCKKTMRNKE